MSVLLQIDTCLGILSTGRITESIAKVSRAKGWKTYIAHGARFVGKTEQISLPVVSKTGEYWHYTQSLLLDNHGLSSSIETRKLIKKIEKISPDIIHLHCIHGYFINYKILFDYLSKTEIPVVWTFHDCWAFTGHCAYFDSINCEKWKTECQKCELKTTYPKSLIFDRSRRNYKLKKKLFTSFTNRMVIVPVSYWIEELVHQSFFKETRIKTIHNGTDIDIFMPYNTFDLREKYCLGDKIVVLGVALPWSPRKGLSDMIELSQILPREKYQVLLIGLDEKQIENLPEGIIGLKKTNNTKELAKFYSLASIFINPTYEDNFPTTNIEALACGTPVITYNTGGSPEAISDETGWVVEKGNVNGIAEIVQIHIGNKTRSELELQSYLCRERAIHNFNKDKKFLEYLGLYSELVSK